MIHYLSAWLISLFGPTIIATLLLGAIAWLQSSQSIISPITQLIHIYSHVNTLRPRQNGRHFADDILKSRMWWMSVGLKLSHLWLSSGICHLCWSAVSGLTHWGRVRHICVSKLTIIGSDNGLSPDRRQAIIQTNAGILLIWNSGKNFSEIWSKILTISFQKMHLNMSSAKWRPFCRGLNVLSSNLKLQKSKLNFWLKSGISLKRETVQHPWSGKSQRD